MKEVEFHLKSGREGLAKKFETGQEAIDAFGYDGVRDLVNAQLMTKARTKLQLEENAEVRRNKALTKKRAHEFAEAKQEEFEAFLAERDEDERKDTTKTHGTTTSEHPSEGGNQT